jgi:hypothetical protein
MSKFHRPHRVSRIDPAAKHRSCLSALLRGTVSRLAGRDLAVGGGFVRGSEAEQRSEAGKGCAAAVVAEVRPAPDGANRISRTQVSRSDRICAPYRVSRRGSSSRSTPWPWQPGRRHAAGSGTARSSSMSRASPSTHASNMTRPFSSVARSGAPMTPDCVSSCVFQCTDSGPRRKRS